MSYWPADSLFNYIKGWNTINPTATAAWQAADCLKLLGVCMDSDGSAEVWYAQLIPLSLNGKKIDLHGVI